MLANIWAGRKLETVAHHEAGHCVALLHLRCNNLIAVSVFPQGQRYGHTGVRLGRCARNETPLLANPREQALADMVFHWAGRAAERALLGGEEPPWPVCSRGPFSDGQSAWRLALQLTRTRAEAERLYFAQYERAFEIVSRRDRWCIVTAIAEELQVRHRLEGREVWEIACRALGVKPAART